MDTKYTNRFRSLEVLESWESWESQSLKLWIVPLLHWNYGRTLVYEDIHSVYYTLFNEDKNVNFNKHNNQTNWLPCHCIINLQNNIVPDDFARFEENVVE